jgi:hypothetical protein
MCHYSNNFFISANAFADANKQIGNAVIDFPQSSPTYDSFATEPLSTDVLGAVMAQTAGPPGSNPRRVFILGASFLGASFAFSVFAV